MTGLVIDNFAGGGGASTGIEAALGRPVDIAINHSAAAIAMHQANHPETRHYVEDIWEVDPREACGTQPVSLAWFSPDCTHFSRAKGGQPRKKGIRGLAWVVIRWARDVRPRVILLENVEEFQTWGPLDADGRPDPAQIGSTFREWLAALTELGYQVEYRSLVAADYGAPTTRKRLFLIARCDGAPIVWPEETHGQGRLAAWRPAAEIIDWSLPCPSIFERHRPLAEATLRRIAAGIRRYVIESAEPFVIPLTHHGGDRTHRLDAPLRTVTAAHRGELALVAPTLMKNMAHNMPRSPHAPLSTVLSGNHHYLAAAFLAKHYGGVVGHGVERPVGAVTAKDHHALCAAFLTKFYGTSTGAPCSDPIPTVTANGRGGGHLGLVMVHGEPYQIVDIGMRMLQPHELFAAQGFPDDYEIAPHYNGKPLTKTAQTALAGNSVCPPVARALVAQILEGAHA